MFEMDPVGRFYAQKVIRSTMREVKAGNWVRYHFGITPEGSIIKDPEDYVEGTKCCFYGMLCSMTDRLATTVNSTSFMSRLSTLISHAIIDMSDSTYEEYKTAFGDSWPQSIIVHFNDNDATPAGILTVLKECEKRLTRNEHRATDTER